MRDSGKTPRFWLVAILASACVFAGLPLTRNALLASAGKVLILESRLDDAQVVVLPTGIGPAGPLEVVDVVGGQKIPRILIMSAPLSPQLESAYAERGVVPVEEAVLAKQLLVRLGIDAAKIEVLHVVQGGTNGESEGLMRWCDERGIARVVVVSSRHHSRRFARVLRRNVGERRLAIAVRPARLDPFDPTEWWQDRDNLRVGLIELQKLLLDVTLHPLS
jgi:hypothetical protein